MKRERNSVVVISAYNIYKPYSLNPLNVQRRMHTWFNLLQHFNHSNDLHVSKGVNVEGDESEEAFKG